VSKLITLNTQLRFYIKCIYKKNKHATSSIAHRTQKNTQRVQHNSTAVRNEHRQTDCPRLPKRGQAAAVTWSGPPADHAQPSVKVNSSNKMLEHDSIYYNFVCFWFLPKLGSRVVCPLLVSCVCVHRHFCRVTTELCPSFVAKQRLVYFCRSTYLYTVPHQFICSARC